MSQIRYVLIQYPQCGGHKRVEVLVGETANGLQRVPLRSGGPR